MRTTVTLDADTEALIREEVRRTGQSFKEVLNASVRRAIGRRAKSGSARRVRPLFRAAFPAEFAGRSLNQVADELDDAETLRELRA